jgi:hypothetical protein
MNLNNLLREIEHCEQKGLFKTADKLSNYLFRIAVTLEEAKSKNKDLASALQIDLRNSIDKILFSIPECSSLRNSPQVLQDYKDNMEQLLMQGKTFEDATREVSQSNKDLAIPGIDKCLDQLGRQMGTKFSKQFGIAKEDFAVNSEDTNAGPSAAPSPDVPPVTTSGTLVNPAGRAAVPMQTV